MPGVVMKSGTIAVILLTLALLTFLLPGSACAAVKNYMDEEHGFSFSYPETWQLYKEYHDIVMVLAPPIDGISAYACVYTFPPFEASEMTEEAIAEDYKKTEDDVEILSYKETKLQGEPCAAVDMAYTSAGKRQFREQIYLANHKGKGYAIVFTALSKDYGKREESFKMILDSFRF